MIPLRITSFPHPPHSLLSLPELISSNNDLSSAFLTDYSFSYSASSGDLPSWFILPRSDSLPLLSFPEWQPTLAASCHISRSSPQPPERWILPLITPLRAFSPQSVFSQNICCQLWQSPRLVWGRQSPAGFPVRSELSASACQWSPNPAPFLGISSPKAWALAHSFLCLVSLLSRSLHPPPWF